MWTRHTHRQTNSRSRAGQQGQSLTEFALTLPLLIGLLVMLMLLAWVGYCYVSIVSAARMGARHLLTYPTEPRDSSYGSDIDAEVKDIVIASAPMLSLQEDQITISPQPPSDRIVGTPSNPVYVEVQVVYPLNLPTIRVPYVISEGSFVLLPPLSLQATSRMRLD